MAKIHRLARVVIVLLFTAGRHATLGSKGQPLAHATSEGSCISALLVLIFDLAFSAFSEFFLS
jgi:hypothetical protein